MARSRVDILILGAGPAGMAAAIELWKAGKSLILVEKDTQVGGLAKTLQFGEFRTDNGPHRFFSKNPYLYEFIQSLLGDSWTKVNRFTRFYIQGKFFIYPMRWKNALSGMGPYKAMRVFTDYLGEKVKYVFKKDEPENFEEYIVQNFGRTLAEFNLLNYTEKIWGLSCSELSADWAKQRIRGLSLGSALKSALYKKVDGPKTLVDQFYYPEYGTGLIYETLQKKMEEAVSILFNSFPTKIEHSGNTIDTVDINSKDGSLEFNPTCLISSIPITEFINLLRPSASEGVKKAVKKLKFRSEVYLFMIINKRQVTRDQWIYFPDKEIPFARISEMKNFSQKMSPEDKTSLFIEFFCWENDEIWNLGKEELLKLAVEWLEKLKLLKKSEVMDYYVYRKKAAYPVYDLGYQKNLEIVKNYLDGFSNLIYIGRSGRFKYTNQDHSLEMGFLAARSLIEGKKYNIDAVGGEEEYFEKGQMI